MPIATPEVYAEMLDRAKAGAFAYPAINVTSSQTLNAALQRLRRGRQRRHHPGLDRRRGVPLRPDGQGHGDRRRSRSPRSPHEVAKNYPVNIALHTDHCPKDKLDGFVRPLLAHLRRSGSTRGEDAAVPVAHVGRLGRAAGGEPADRRGAARQVRRGARSSSRSRSASSAARRTASPATINEKLYTTAEDALATVEALGARREGPLHARR